MHPPNNFQLVIKRYFVASCGFSIPARTQPAAADKLKGDMLAGNIEKWNSVRMNLPPGWSVEEGEAEIVSPETGKRLK